ncbi:MAG: glycosyltransferase family 2 protein [Oscillospiraceae bacterium]|nr:glycosyltransferase family 2 protein [Oscillospiraceae bacterium]
MNISLCIVTYNNENTIERVLDSIFEFSGNSSLRVFISDNASSDNTVEKVRHKFPQVNVVCNKENKGFGFGHNSVIGLLDSDYHFIVNPDIILTNDILGEMAEYLDNNPDVVMAVPKFFFENGNEQFTPKLRPKLRFMIGGRLERYGGIFKKWRDEYTMRNAEPDSPVDVGFCSGCFIAVRTEIFKKIGGFDERYFLYNEDADITRMAQKYGRTVYAPQFHVTHLWERAYMKNIKYFFIQISSMIKYFYKWRSDGKYVGDCND